jgi:hypothetical protein
MLSSQVGAIIQNYSASPNLGQPLLLITFSDAARGLGNPQTRESSE